MITDFYKKLSANNVRYDQKYSLQDRYMEQCRKHKAVILANTGIKSDTLNNLLKGGNTSKEVAGKIAYCVGLPIDKLFVLRSGDGGLDPKTILHHHRLLTAIFNRAMRWQIITSNPATSAEVPKVTKKAAKVYNVSQANHMFRLLMDEPIRYQLAVYIGVYGGLRLGEAYVKLKLNF